MQEENNNINSTIDSKLKTTFAVFVILVLMAAIAIVFLEIEIPLQQQETSQHSSDIDTPLDLTTSNLSELVEEIKSQSSSFLDKTKATVTTTTTTTTDESQGSNPFLELSCDQLSDIASSFEDRWGSALVEYSVRCNNDE